MNTIPKGFKIPYNFILRNQNIIICTLLKPANDYPFTNVDGGIDVVNFQECVNDAAIIMMEQGTAKYNGNIDTAYREIMCELVESARAVCEYEV